MCYTGSVLNLQLLAEFEMVRLGIAEDQPVCVQQWTGLIAVNYPARKFGITRHMDVSCAQNRFLRITFLTDIFNCQVHEAKKKCPHLQTIHVATCEYAQPFNRESFIRVQV